MSTQELSDSEQQHRKKRTVSADEILTYTGEFGRFQQLLVAAICALYFFVSFQLLITYFISDTPSWRCRPNSTLCPFNKTLTENDNRRCDIPRTEWYYTESKHFSLVTEFDVECKHRWILGLISSIHFVGYGIGSIVLGYVGDKYGRKVLLFPSLIVMLVVGFISSFLASIYLIIVCRFIAGFFIPGILVQGNILLSEFVGNKTRPFATMIPFVILSVGYCVLDFNAYMLKNWKTLTRVSTVPYLLLLPLYFFVPESGRWLHINGRNGQAMHVFKKVARWNKRILPTNVQLPSDSNDFDNRSDDHLAHTGESLCTPKIFARTLVMCFIWLFSTMNFYGLQFAADDLGGSMYLDFLYLSLAQIPSGLLAMVLSNKFGRKLANLLPLTIAGATCICIAFVPSNHDVRMIFAMIGVLFGTITVEAVYLWSGELFPVNIRSQGIGCAQFAARIGATSAPWIIDGLKVYGASIPYIVLGVPSLFAALLGMSLPETKITLKENRPNEVKMQVNDETVCTVNEKSKLLL